MCIYVSPIKWQSRFIGVQKSRSIISKMHAEFCLKYPPTGFRHRPKGRFKPSGAFARRCWFTIMQKTSGQWWQKNIFATFLQAKKQAIDSLLYAWFFVNHRRSICPEVVANLEVSIFQNLPSLLVDFFSFVRMDISSFFLPCVGFYNLLDYPTTS